MPVNKRNKKLFLSSFSSVLIAIITNLSLEKNFFVFPILNGGVVEIKNDGFLKIFSDGSGGFSVNDHPEDGCTGCGEIKYKKLNKGDKFPVLSVSISHPNFSTSVNLDTEIGQFSEDDWKNGVNMNLNKPVESIFLKKIGLLMYYPILFPLVLSYRSNLRSPESVL